MTTIKNDGVQSWSKWDKQTVVVETPEGEKVDHGASVGKNLQACGTALLEAVDPTDKFRRVFGSWGPAGNDPANKVLRGLMYLVGGPICLLAEGLDICLAPFKIAKNIGDAALHAAAAGLDKVAPKE